MVFAPEEVDAVGAIRTGGFPATAIDGHGRDGAVQVVYCFVRRRALRQFLACLPADPLLFYTIDSGGRSARTAMPVVD